MSGTASKGFAITISAVDAATKQIDAINNRIRAMQAPAERLGKSFSKLAETTGITRLAHGMQNVADSSFKAFENMGRMIAPLGLLTGAASIAGISRLVTAFASSGAELYRAGQRARISAGDLAAYQGAADLAGSSSAAMGAGIKTLNDNMFHALQGTAPEAVIAFNKLHISMADLVNGDGSLKSVTEILPKVIQGLSDIRDPTFRAQIATMLFGGATEALMPVLQLTAKQFEEYVAAARRYGTINDAQAKTAYDLDTAQRALTVATIGLGNAIVEHLAPVLTPMLVDLTNWLASNRAIIATDLRGWIDSTIPGVVAFGKDANLVAQYIGGWKIALEGFGALLLGGWALKMVASLNPLVRLLLLAAVTIEKLQSFQERNAPANLPAGSPFWRDVSDRDQSNYVNSPRSQEFLRANAPGPAHDPYWWLHPNSWFSRGGATHPSPLAADKSMDPDKRALLDAISIPESSTAYDAKNPGSSAHGRYQFIDSTDTDVTQQTGKPGQDPVSQDQKGWFLADRDYRARTGRDLLTDYKAGKYAEIAETLNKTWPSMPGGSQQNTSMAQWINRNIDARAAEQQAQAVNVAAAAPPANVAGAAAPPANVAGGAGAAPAQPQPQTQTIKGSADLRVKITTDPGTTAKTTASTSGDVFSGAPRIDTAMAY